MYKHALQCIAFILVLALIFGYAQSEYEQIDYSDYKSSPIAGVRLFNPKIMEEVENKAEHIVKGKFWDDAEVYYQRSIHLTISTFEISDVYKGDFQSGDQIKIVEDYHISEASGEKIIYHLGNYYPSDVGREYILFLDEYGLWTELSGKYYTTGCEYGRYAVLNIREKSADISSFTNSKMNLAEGNTDTYRNIYQEVIEKYMR